MAEEETSSIKHAKAVVLHVGANNVSDADQPEAISGEMKDLADTVKNINKDAKIIVSSVLPCRNDKLVHKMITTTNQSLREACEEKGFHFLANTPSFIINGVPDLTLYKDNIHQDQDQDSLLVKRRNDNHSPGPVIRELVPSSHQRSELSNTILCIFSG